MQDATTSRRAPARNLVRVGPSTPGMANLAAPVRTEAASSTRPRRRQLTEHEEFRIFLRQMARIAAAPITVPLRLIRQTLTSTLTLSVVLKLVLLGFIVLASFAFSLFAVGAFWFSWGTGRAVETEGWLIYGSRSHRTPHTLIPLLPTDFQEDLRYDVQVEMELVRPTRGHEEMGNFMLSLELRSAREIETVLLRSAQPSLPPAPLTSPVIPLPTIPLHLLPPCLLPWPVRFLCPSRLLGLNQSPSQLRARRHPAGDQSPVRGQEVVLLHKELLEGVVLRPSRGSDGVAGAVFVSIGREDSFSDSGESGLSVASSGAGARQPREVRTTGWVVVRFVPKPTGMRWLLASHPLPPLLLLPPITLSLTMSSSIIAFGIITCLRRPNKKQRARTRELERERSRASEKRVAEDRLVDHKAGPEAWEEAPLTQRSVGPLGDAGRSAEVRSQSAKTSGHARLLSMDSAIESDTVSSVSHTDGQEHELGSTTEAESTLGVGTETETETETELGTGTEMGDMASSDRRRGSEDSSDGWEDADH